MGDALFDPAFCQAVAVAMAQGLVLPAGQGEVRFTASEELRRVAPEDIEALEVSRPTVASSNTAVMLGEESCSFSRSDVVQALHQWLDHAEQLNS